jgi:hypothetical protein
MSGARVGRRVESLAPAGPEAESGKVVLVTVVLGFVVGFLALRFVLLAGRDMLHAPVLERVNFRGAPIATACGLFVVMAVLLVEAGRSVLGAFEIGDPPGLNPARPLVLFAVFGFGLLGFVDDMLGSEDRGFRGHVVALVHGRLTSGMLAYRRRRSRSSLAAEVGFVTVSVWWPTRRSCARRELGQPARPRPGSGDRRSLVAYVPPALVAGTGRSAGALAPVMGRHHGPAAEDLREG